MSHKNPCDFHSDLTLERVQTIGKLIRDARNEAMREHDPERGDTPWSSGCRGFSWAWQRLLNKAGSHGFEWLTIVDPTMHFIGAIGQVRFRFYRGIAEKPTARTLKQSYAERQQMNLNLGDVPMHQDLIFRFAVETDDRGLVERVIFAAVQPNGHVVSSIDVTSNTPIPSIIRIPRSEERGVELGAAQVRGKRKEQKKIANGETD